MAKTKKVKKYRKVKSLSVKSGHMAINSRTVSLTKSIDLGTSRHGDVDLFAAFAFALQDIVDAQNYRNTFAEYRFVKCTLTCIPYNSSGQLGVKERLNIKDPG